MGYFAGDGLRGTEQQSQGLKNFGGGGEEFAGVGGLRVGEEVVGALLFYELALVEDADLVGDGGDDGEVRLVRS